MIRNIYPEKLSNLIGYNNNSYIPRKLKIDERLRLYKRYWTSYSNDCFKVDKVYFIDGIEYYSVKYSNLLHGEISFPVDSDYIYELHTDRNNIKSINNIINTKASFLGSEIKYWFHVNNIDLSSIKYSGFWSFLDPNSKSVISDNKYYFLFASYDNDIYSDCKISLDRNRSK